MHPLQKAIEVLHNEVSRLHDATKDLDFNAEEKDHLIEIILGYLPAAMDAASVVTKAAIAYFTE